MEPLAVALICAAVIVLIIAIAVVLIYKNDDKTKNDEKTSVDDEALYDDEIIEDDEIPEKPMEPVDLEEAKRIVREEDAKKKADEEAEVAKIKALIAEALAESKKINGLTPEQIEIAKAYLVEEEKERIAKQNELEAKIRVILIAIKDKPYHDLFAKIMADVKAAKTKEEYEKALAAFEEAIAKMEAE